MNTALRLFLLSTAAMMPLAAAAADDEFSIDEESAHKKPDVTYHNWVQGGWGYNSNSSFKHGQYSGLVDDGGFFVGEYGFLYRDPQSPLFARSYGTNIGLDSRRIEAEAGMQGQFKAGLLYDQLPSNFYRGTTPYTNAGSSQLELPSGFARVANTGLMTALPGQSRPVEIKQERTRYGLGMNWTMVPGWTLTSKVEREDKEGLKPLGVAWGTGFGTARSVIAPEPVEYRTDRVDLGVAYVGRRAQMQVGYNLSLFDNDNEDLRLQNPYSTGGANGTIQLAPDNTAHQLTVAGGYDVTPDTRVNANFSHGIHLQDENFLPYSSSQAATATPRRSLDGRINTTVANMELVTKPIPKVDVRAKYRFTDRDNDTPRNLYTYVINDSNAQGATTTQSRYNMPYSFREHFASTEAGYRLLPGTKVTAGYDLRTMERSYSEVEQTTEHTGRMLARSNLGAGFTGNLKYARAWRSGGAYVYDRPFFESYTTTHINAAAFDTQNHPALRMFHMADRIKDNIGGGVTYTPAQDWQVGVNAAFTLEDYDDSEVGVTGITSYNNTLDLSYSPRDGITAYGFYTYERRMTELAGWSWSNAATAGNTSRRWWMDMLDTAHTIGLGTKAKVTDSLTLAADYSYSYSVTNFIPNSAAPSTITFQPLNDLPTRIHNVGVNATYDFTQTFSVGLGYAVEIYSSEDWTDVGQRGLTNVLSMGYESPDFIAHLVGASVKMKF